MIVRLMTSKGKTGDISEITWDLFPIVSADKTMHLQEDGLPRVGTRIEPGMIIIGSIAKSTHFDAGKQPTCLEIHGLEFEELRKKYGHMWMDMSLYADGEHYGTVKRAHLEREGDFVVAIVELEP